MFVHVYKRNPKHKPNMYGEAVKPIIYLSSNADVEIPHRKKWG